MAHIKFLPLVVCALSALSIGCADVSDTEMEADAIDEIPQETMGGGLGSGGINHLDADDVHTNAYYLYNSARDNLAAFNFVTFKWNLKGNTANTNLKGSAGGRSVLDYAVRCGVPAGHNIWYTSGMFSLSETGEGHMDTAMGWKTTGLTMTQAEDLFACVIAHMNGFGEYVPIHLSGPNVAEVSDAAVDGFNWEEALFAVDITINPLNGGPMFKYHAYPFPHPECPTIVTGIDSRICGSTPACGLTIHPSADIASDCVTNVDGTYCDLNGSGSYVPMVKTRLKSTDVSKLYRTCGN